MNYTNLYIDLKREIIRLEKEYYELYKKWSDTYHSRQDNGHDLDYCKQAEAVSVHWLDKWNTVYNLKILIKRLELSQSGVKEDNSSDFLDNLDLDPYTLAYAKEEWTKSEEREKRES